jgi:hypothetical protein
MKQITIVAEDRPGLAADIASALGAANVNIDTLTAETIGSAMVGILTVDKYDEALRALAAAGFQAFSEEVLVVQLNDRPGELARLMLRFKDAGISLRSMRFIRRSDDKAFVALGTERTQEALELVRDVIVS